MNDTQRNLLELLEHINPALLDYQEWLNVGFALKHEGYTANDWDNWSKNDSRYHPGECFKKWETFVGTGTPVTGGTIYQLAVDQGWSPPHKNYDDGRGELDWDSTIKYDNDYRIIDKDWVEGQEFHEPTTWDPVGEITKYLEILFDSTENVGYVTETWEKDGKHLPTKGAFDRTAGQLIQELNRCNGDLGAVFGDYKEEAGAWIRFNPLDGKGVKNDNVTDYRYALVESDNMDLAKQNAIIRELELPVACLVYSGGKSIHAIVRVDAGSYDEYRKRVDYLYSICKKNGLNVDSQNKNPSRLSRMPGIVRKGHKQFLIDTNIGKANWEEWFKHIEDLNDELPDPEGLEEFWDNMPNLAPELIHGVLRQGHKMLMAGPSKAGKSFALIELCIALAEGKGWLGWQCAQGKVLYVNLELDRASCFHRFKDVYTALGLAPSHIKNIDIWNLRGNTVPMDKLAPKLIRRAAKKNYIAIIIDPIYKVLTGDENSADQMAHFTNQFDKVATELGASVIYCHHHSKGSQGGKKSMDRASGSGVFARDPDALIDLVELEITDDLMKQQTDKLKAETYKAAIQEFNLNFYQNKIGLDDLESAAKMKEHALKSLNSTQYYKVDQYIKQAETKLKQRTAWRVEGTLREFAKFNPVNIWFGYPVHTVDDIGVLSDITPEDTQPVWKKNFDKKKSKQDNKEDRKQSFDTAYSALFDGTEPVSVDDLAEYLGVSEKTVRRRVKEISGYEIDGNKVSKT
ncbi:AAA family ATPase [Aerococcaceae bacterium NML190938]|nr:AAA family ATPase [Aerococcaceae bacterium NML190938]